MDTGPQTPERRPDRRARAWAVVAAIVVLLALAVAWLSQPVRVAGLVLDRTGDALGLEITASGVSEYRLRGTPRLVVRDLVARQPGATTPLLTAERVSLSLPWSTLRARGADLTVERVELDAPRLDLAALQRWQETRPPSGEVRIPTLTDGLAVVRGEVNGAGWSFERLKIDLPSLAPDAAVSAHASGRFRNGDTTVPFNQWLALTRPAVGAGLGAAGVATVVTPDWRLTMRSTLSGRLFAGDDGLGLDDLRVGAAARHLGAGRELNFHYGIAGPLRYRNGRLSIEPLGLALRGQGWVPRLDADGAFAWEGGLALRLDGALQRWPLEWPALPVPLSDSASPLPFELAYDGPADLSGAAALRLRRDATRLDTRFRLPAVLDWYGQFATGTPLPPLDGTLTTPRLEIAGATLEGVQVEFDDGNDGDD